MKRKSIIRSFTGEWLVVGGKWWEKDRFSTWDEAMAYADKRARTIQVTLPRLGEDAIEILSREGIIPYRPKDAETIAQALLAVARKEQS